MQADLEKENRSLSSRCAIAEEQIKVGRTLNPKSSTLNPKL